MPLYSTQNILNGGEISPQLSARFDLPRYQSGAYAMLNLVPMPQGGVTKRPGFKFLGLSKNQVASNNVKLFGFVYSSNQGRILEFGDRYMRVWLQDGTLVKDANNQVYELVTPYISQQVMELSIAQSADVIFVAHTAHAPVKISRYADNNWKIETLTFLPMISATSFTGISAQGTSLSTESVYNEYVVTALDGNGNESQQSISIGITTRPLAQSYYVLMTWTEVANATEYRVYKKRGGVYGFIGRSNSFSFEDKNIAPDTEDTPPRYKNPFNEVNQYPALVFLHQQRLGFASSNARPLTVWLTQSANLESMAASVPPKDDDSIEATLAATQVHRILSIGQDRDNLIIFTESSEWLFSPTDGGALTPTNASFQLQGKHGSEPFSYPLNTGNAMLFVQRGGNVIRDFGYNYQGDKYESVDLTILARNLLQDNGIVSWAWQQEPYNILWCSLTNGKIIALTYMRDHEIIGWHRHESDGFIENIATIPNVPDDSIFAIILRKNGTGEFVRTIEKLGDFFNSSDLPTAYHVDSGKTLSDANLKEVTGLEHLEGRTVHIFADGAVQNPRQVINGKITLDKPCYIAHVGLPYTGLLIPTVPENILQNGTTLFHIRNITSISMRIYNSMSFFVSLAGMPKTPLSNHTITVIENIKQATTSPTQFELADVSLNLSGGFNKPQSPVFEMPDPSPATILAFVTTVDLAPQPATQH